MRSYGVPYRSKSAPTGALFLLDRVYALENHGQAIGIACVFLARFSGEPPGSAQGSLENRRFGPAVLWRTMHLPLGAPGNRSTHPIAGAKNVRPSSLRTDNAQPITALDADDHRRKPSGLPRGSGGPSISRNCPAIPLPPSPRSHDPFPTTIRRGIRQVPRRISPPEVAPLPSTRSLVRTSAARLHPLANAQTSLCIAMPGQTAPFKPAARRLAVLPNPSIERSIVIIASADSPCRAASHCCK